jgi:putative transposase
MPYIYRSQAKSGTCSFYAYATLYVIKKGKRLTLAIRGIRNRDTNVAIITYLLASISSLKIDIKTLYLDRGFFQYCCYSLVKSIKDSFHYASN